MDRHSDNLTLYEHQALSRAFNLADGHAHQRQSIEQHRIVGQMPSIFYRVEAASQYTIENDFLASFFALAGQTRAAELNSSAGGTTMLCYSASISIEIVAYMLKQQQLRTALIEPTFDNLPGIMRRVGVDVVPLTEQVLIPELNLDMLSSVDAGALFLVLPNNPTGNLLSRDAFTQLVRFCADHHKLLAVDFCFRFFSEEMNWDQYALALDAGIDFMFVEDTGKTWPSLDLKASILTVSPNLYKNAFNIHNDILLNVSPFILEVVRQYIDSSRELGIARTITNIVKANRDYLREKIAAKHLEPYNLNSTISVEWLRITTGQDAESLRKHLIDKGVFVLPGMQFFWSDPTEGRKYVRIALMRDPDMFRAAIDILADALT